MDAWDAEDWYTPLGGDAQVARHLGITANTTDEELDDVYYRENEVAKIDGVKVTGIRACLVRIRSTLGK